MKKKRSKLGAFLRMQRLSLNLTLREAATKSGLSQGYLSDLEDGSKDDNPSLNTIRALTKTYRLEPTVWFGQSLL